MGSEVLGKNLLVQSRKAAKEGLRQPRQELNFAALREKILNSYLTISIPSRNSDQIPFAP